jgi:hypothetical protein
MAQDAAGAVHPNGLRRRRNPPYGPVGAGIASKISTVYQLAEAGSGIAKARYLGQIGEEAIGATESRVGIKVGGQTLFPDILGSNGIQEAKNVATISSRDAAQISSYVDYTALRGLNPVQVFTRPGTDVSAIQGLINAGCIEQKILPGINSLGVNLLSAADSAAIGATFGAADSAIRSREQERDK